MPELRERCDRLCPAWPRGRNPAIESAAVGIVVGAAAGAAIGAAAGNAGAGAAIGGATGLVGGTAVGAHNAAADSFDLQSRYNVAYNPMHVLPRE
jgi:uncharacterized membrane protein